MKTTMTPRVRDDIYLHLAEAARPENEKPHEQRGRGLGNALLSCARYFGLALAFGVGLLLCYAACALLVNYILSVPSRPCLRCSVVNQDGASFDPAILVLLSASGGYLILRACRLIIHNSDVFVGIGTLMWGLSVLRYPLDPRTLSLTLCLISLGGYCVCKGIELVERLRRRPRSFIASPIMVRVALVFSLVAFAMLAFMDAEYRRNRYPFPRVPWGEAESVRAALANYAAQNVDHGYSFPAAPISDHQTFRALVYANDANVGETEPSITVRRYIPMDHDADGVYEDYTICLQIPKWEYDFIIVRPTEMTLCPTAKLAKPLALADILRQKGMLLDGTDC